MSVHRRGAVTLTALLAVFAMFAACLVKIQLVDGADYAALAESRYRTTLTLTAARGSIYDSRGTLLAGDRLGLALVLDGTAVTDGVLQAVIELLPDSGFTVADLRAAMTKAGYNRKTPFVLATDVPHSAAAAIESAPAQYNGVQVVSLPVREYPCGRTAAHLIGTVGSLTAEEYAAHRDGGYLLTDTIGKSGVEAALESVLRGKCGTQLIRRDSAGNVTTETVTPPTAGNSVYLTLRGDLQTAVQQILCDTMASLRTTDGEGSDVASGSAVLLDVHGGAVLAAASVPDYDLSQYAVNAAALLEDPDKPLFNRALFGTFPCGSVIKPAVAVAGLSAGKITADAPLITCDGAYHYYEAVGFAPKCLGRHGDVALTHALRRSCNVYFYELGRLLGITRMNQTLSEFGLGEKSGIELSESRGVLASPDSKDGIWVAGDTCQCAIGQLDQRFTPLQLASYAMTLANNGTRYRAYLVDRIERHDGTVVSQTSPQVLSRVQAPAEAFDAVRRGMVAVTEAGGTAYAAFRDASYTVAAKTGTAQNGAHRSDHGVFIAYAPAEAPQVALAVVLENGTVAPTVSAARQILDVYFSSEAAKNS